MRPGDLLSTIAALYNVSAEAIIRANPDLDPSIIIAGTQLRIPQTSLNDPLLVPGTVVLLDPISSPNQGVDILVTGLARPFEGQGEWYVIQLDEDGEIPALPAAIASGGFTTNGEFGAASAFSFTIEPDLPEGDYAVLAGERPPDGSTFFVGAGQRIRVNNDPSAVDPNWDPVISSISIVNPILILD